ncbi:hypothetical protein BDQ17DRAFT_1435937 [Cyathus striatus]|nr:hypothetical protein BDQ17DRAFT_1435937 [Cyathus striatus]
MDLNSDIVSAVGTIDSDVSSFDNLSSFFPHGTPESGSVISEGDEKQLAVDESQYTFALTTPSMVDETEPSIDPTEWHTLSSLLPLFQLLPALKEQSGYYVLSGRITGVDISRLCTHAKLVRTVLIAGPCSDIDIPEPDTPSSDPAAADTAEAILPCAIKVASSRRDKTAKIELLYNVLLPSLECLTVDMGTWVDSSVSAVQFQHMYPLFLVDSLRILQLDGILPGVEHIGLPLLSSLSCETPRLQKLVLSGKCGYQFSSQYINSVIVDMIELHHLELCNVVDSVNVDLGCTIGRLPQLSMFTLRDTKGDYFTLDCENDSDVAAKGFKSLRYLDIMAPFQLILCILRRIEPGALESLDLTPVVDEKCEEKDASNKEVAHIQAEACARAEAEQARVATEEARVKAGAARIKAEEARLEADNIANGSSGTRMPGCASAINADVLSKTQCTEDGSELLTGAISTQSSPIRTWADIFDDILQLLPSCSPSLKSLIIGLIDTNEQERTFYLPSRYLGSLRSLGSLETL